MACAGNCPPVLRPQRWKLRKNSYHSCLSMTMAELCLMMKEFFAEAGHRLGLRPRWPHRVVPCAQRRIRSRDLDVMLPVFDGLTLLQQLRRRRDLPAIMLTARVQQQDRILGLNSGADD